MLRYRFKPAAYVALGLLITVRLVPAQQAEPPGIPAKSGTPTQTAPRVPASGSHKFWDQENMALFAGVTVVRALDYTSTQHFRERGVDEILLTNGIVDNKSLFAGVEAAGVAGSIALSYWLHH